MADKSVVHIGENSPEQVAYKLLSDVMAAEKRTTNTYDIPGDWKTADRAYILDTYAECHQAIVNSFNRKASAR
jgi:hypothetical protein